MKAHTLADQMKEIEIWPQAAQALAASGKFEMGAAVQFGNSAFIDFGVKLAAEGMVRTPFPFTYFEFAGKRPAAFFDHIACIAWCVDGRLYVRSYVLVGEKWGRIPATGTLGSDGFGWVEDRDASGAEELAIKATILVASSISALMSKSTQVSYIEAPHRLNRQRTKHGRTALPEYHTVKIGLPYSEAQASAEGEKRAAMSTHWRRGHFRTLASGQVVPVAPAIVNATDAAVKPRDYRFSRSVS